MATESYARQLQQQPREVQQHMARAPGHTVGYTTTCPACRRAVDVRLNASQAAAKRRVQRARRQYRRMLIWFWLIAAASIVAGYCIATLVIR